MFPRFHRCALRANHDGDHLFIYSTDPASHDGECDAREPSDLPLMLVCSWCSQTMREGVRPISHGICAPCKTALDLDTDEHTIRGIIYE